MAAIRSHCRTLKHFLMFRCYLFVLNIIIQSKFCYYFERTKVLLLKAFIRGTVDTRVCLAAASSDGKPSVYTLF